MDTEDDPHRPRNLTEMAGASDWKRLHDILHREEPPHVVLVGPAGIGKSCAIRLSLSGTITLWLRCSQDPTLRESRDRIKAAARRRVEAGRINWIVLEHADLLHTDAQAFLRRIIETSMGASRFILEVRDVAAISEPLLSRAILYNAPQLVKHEIRTEIQHRAPACPFDVADRLAEQSGGNIKWAILQGLGGSDGFLESGLDKKEDVHTWNDILRAMETLQNTGSSPRAWLSNTSTVWERPGGACPWALTAHTLAKQLC